MCINVQRTLFHWGNYFMFQFSKQFLHQKKYLLQLYTYVDLLVLFVPFIVITQGVLYHVIY